MLVCRKSSVSSRSSFPSAACSGQATSLGRCASGVSAARSELSAPSRCRRKYSLPLADEPSRLARQIDRIRGKFSGDSGSSHANLSSPALSWSTTCSAGDFPAAAASFEISCGLRLKVG